ncbi:radical SAM protein [Candidatus Geothermarchaeota archaeon ex4572_27]|nr:MAG: radical SAM protein [Candidatus Geothermarchaeota archaeon ex4572_27]
MKRDVEALAEELRRLTYELGPIRPPSESRSLLIRVTRNCPWSRCGFCYGTFYNRGRFEVRPIAEVKRDVDTAARIVEIYRELERVLGGPEWVANVISPIYLYGKPWYQLGEDERRNCEALHNAYIWYMSGMATVFLQDADSMILKCDRLAEVVRYVGDRFPSVRRISAYARAKSLVKKDVEDLRIVRRAGLVRLHVGLETGDDELLRLVNKGVTAEEQVEAGRKALEAGFELTEYVMPGLGGKRYWRQHAINTAKALNRINPTYVRFRRFVPKPGTPMYEQWRRGELQLLSPHELLRELKLLIENLNVTSRLCFDHIVNPAYRIGGTIVPLFSQDYEGYKLPEEKERLLSLIEQGLRIDEKLWITTEELVEMGLI